MLLQQLRLFPPAASAVSATSFGRPRPTSFPVTVAGSLNEQGPGRAAPGRALRRGRGRPAPGSATTRRRWRRRPGEQDDGAAGTRPGTDPPLLPLRAELRLGLRRRAPGPEARPGLAGGGGAGACPEARGEPLGPRGPRPGLGALRQLLAGSSGGPGGLPGCGWPPGVPSPCPERPGRASSGLSASFSAAPAPGGRPPLGRWRAASGAGRSCCPSGDLLMPLRAHLPAFGELAAPRAVPAEDVPYSRGVPICRAAGELGEKIT